MASKPSRVFEDVLPSQLFGDLLTFNKLLTRPVIHLIYWSGLLVILIGAAGFVGAAIGVVIKDGIPLGLLLAIPTLVVGALVSFISALIWRSFCEFYVAVFRISEDLSALRSAVEQGGQALPVRATASATTATTTPDDPQTASVRKGLERIQGLGSLSPLKGFDPDPDAERAAEESIAVITSPAPFPASTGAPGAIGR
ncbi:MAG: DUF4282 domain-containing protein [Asticcacaulis sp.]